LSGETRSLPPVRIEERIGKLRCTALLATIEPLAAGYLREAMCTATALGDEPSTHPFDEIRS